MTITLQYRGQLATALGTSTETTKIASDTTLQSIIDATAARMGDLAPLCQTLLIAIDGQQATDFAAPIPESTREITLMPPIAGG